MAKKRDMKAEEAVERATLEGKVRAEEAAEKSTDERVAEVFSQPEPGTVEHVSFPEASPETLASLNQAANDSIPDPSDVRVVVPVTPAAPVESEPVPETVEEGFLREARHTLEVANRGDAVSPGELKRLLSQAVGLVARG